MENMAARQPVGISRRLICGYLVGAVVLFALLRTAWAAPASSAGPPARKGGEVIMLVDNFQSETAIGFPKNAWRFSGPVEKISRAGIPVLRVSGGVPSEKASDFSFAALDLTHEGQPFDASRYAGVRLVVRGNRQPCAVRLRTAPCRGPAEFYEAVIATDGQWQVVNLPFAAFQGRGVQAALDPAQLTEIGLAGGAKSRAGVSLPVSFLIARVLFYSGDLPTFRKLSPQERAVLIGHGTELPFSGAYEHTREAGGYACKQCGTLLFQSSDKFDSGCGWPSFDHSLPGRVLRLPDPDGQRTEILCAVCGGHLGHVFVGEGFTDKNTRYCVNSISLDFRKGKTLENGGEPEEHPSETRPVPPSQADRETAVFAAGCFWGVEFLFQDAPGVLETRVGYTGGHVPHPTYEQVCAGTTGHAEALEVVFDPRRTTYEALVRLFFETHDFSQEGGQGPDIGDQYRSEIFTRTQEQKEIAEKVIRILIEKGLKVTTRVTPAGRFWPAEAYHQDYYRRKGGVPYCHFLRKVF